MKASELYPGGVFYDAFRDIADDLESLSAGGGKIEIPPELLSAPPGGVVGVDNRIEYLIEVVKKLVESNNSSVKLKTINDSVKS